MACATAVFKVRMVVTWWCLCAQEAMHCHQSCRHIHTGTVEIVHDVQGDLARSLSSKKGLVSAAQGVHAVPLLAV